MLKFYFSEDIGLLNNKLSSIIKPSNNFTSFVGPTLYDISLLLMQQSTINHGNKFIFQNYSESLTDLAKLLKEINLSEYEIVVTSHTSKKITIPKILALFIENADCYLPKLKTNSKKTYIRSLNSELKTQLTKDQLLSAEKFLPNDSGIINNFFKALTIYKITDPISDKCLKFLLKSHVVDIDYFSFFELYLSDNKNKWLELIAKTVKNNTDLQAFLRSFAYKCSEFAEFVRLRKNIKFQDLIALNIRPFFIYSKYETIYNNHSAAITRYLQSFLLELYIFLHSSILKTDNNPSLLTAFLLTWYINDFR